MVTIGLILGSLLLVLGADFLVRGASGLALAAGISRLTVGLTVVAYGTSAPELFVSGISAHNGASDLAIGNVVGSNIFNTLTILGLSALVTPLLVNVHLFRFDFPVMIGSSLLTAIFAADGLIAFPEGVVLILGAILYTVFTVTRSRRTIRAEKAANLQSEESNDNEGSTKWGTNLLLVVVGLVSLVVGSEIFLWSATEIALALGVSKVVIGLTIVAAGTSLPELATTVMAGYRGERDIAVGNVVGSNIFNIFSVLGISAILAPGGAVVDPSLLSVDIPVMVAALLLLVIVATSDRNITRWKGGILFTLYVIYTWYLIERALGGTIEQGSLCYIQVFFVTPALIGALLVNFAFSLTRRAR